MSRAEFEVAWKCFENGHEEMGRMTLRNAMQASMARSFPWLFPPSRWYRIGLRRWDLR